MSSDMKSSVLRTIIITVTTVNAVMRCPRHSADALVPELLGSLAADGSQLSLCSGLVLAEVSHPAQAYRPCPGYRPCPSLHTLPKLTHPAQKSSAQTVTGAGMQRPAQLLGGRASSPQNSPRPHVATALHFNFSLCPILRHPLVHRC